jgi:anti-sigma B factor antagonist
MFSVSVDQQGAVPVVKVVGAFTLAQSRKFRDALSKLVESGAKNVVVDLTDAINIDSTGIGYLVMFEIRFRKQGGRLVCVVSPGKVQDSLTVTRLLSIVTAYPTVDLAVSALT